MTTTDLTTHYCQHAELPAWQHELRQSVCLLLALHEPGLDEDALRAALGLLEAELRQALQASHPASAASPEAAETAAVVVQMYQMALLGARTERAALERERPLAEFARTLRPTCGPVPAPGWLLAA